MIGRRYLYLVLFIGSSILYRTIHTWLCKFYIYEEVGFSGKRKIRCLGVTSTGFTSTGNTSTGITSTDNTFKGITYTFNTFTGNTSTFFVEVSHSLQIKEASDILHKIISIS